MNINKMCLRIAVLFPVVVCVFFGGCKSLSGGSAGTSSNVLGPYELNTDGFITNWLVVGPFPNPGDRPDNKGFNVDYLKNYGGEEKHVPFKGMEIGRDDGTTVKWIPYEAKYGSKIDFFEVAHLGLGYNAEDVLAYAACWLECGEDMQVELKVGSDDGYKLWVDHNLLGLQHVYRSAYQDQETYPLKLSKGTHIILIKVDQDYGAFEFMLRLATVSGERPPAIQVWN